MTQIDRMDTDRIKINGKQLTPEDIRFKLQKNKLSVWEKSMYEFILNWFDQNNFIRQNTSGSTGTPKEIKLKKNAMKTSAQKTLQFLGLHENNTAWLCLPINYIAGKMMVVRAIVGNLNLIVSEPTGTPNIPSRKIDFAAMVPLQVQNLIEKKSDFSSLRKIIIGGAAVDYQLQQQIKHVPSEVFATYGMTETCSHIALQRMNGPAPDSAFITLPGISVETDENNCLRINAPDLLEKPVITNDCAEIISESEFKWKGRTDNIINSGGIKIHPEEVENKISDLIHRPFVIVPVPDQRLGQKAILIIEGSKKEINPEQLFNFLQKRMEKYQCPKEIRFLNKFPRNASMKIDRKRIVEQIQ
ncbi:MAG: AMP-binding protein [Prolixibacteraceae bacterium]|nr:AMP-binding protein [Prolixibacteraceae bacterium]